MSSINTRPFICLFFFGLTSCLLGQSNQESVKVTFYYTSSWELTTPERSLYKREAYFDLANMMFDGVYSDYNKENSLIGDGIYDHGVKSGIHSEYNPDHSVKSKIEYSENDYTIWELVEEDKSKGVKNGTGKFTMPYYYLFEMDTRVVWKQGMLHGEFRNGKKIGRWKYFDHQNQPLETDVEVYNNGKFLKRVRFSKEDSTETDTRKQIYLSLALLNAETLLHNKESFVSLNQYFEQYVTYPSSFHRNVTYPDGFKRLLVLLQQLVETEDKYIEVLRIKIDEHGIVSKPTIVRSIDPTFDDRTLRAFEFHEKRFLPAMKNGQPYATTIYIPISNGEMWTRMLKEMPTEWFFDSANFVD